MQTPNLYDLHSRDVKKLQEKIRFFRTQNSSISLQYSSGTSNTTRSKSYKHSSTKLKLDAFDRIIHIDPKEGLALVEPRVTMQELVQATVHYGLIPAVVPEFRGITVGGAIMGTAAESSSHTWGIFNDTCLAYDVICGDGSLLHLSPHEHPDLFYGMAGSYGSLGVLVLAYVKLIFAKKLVHLSYHFFSNPSEAISFMRQLCHSKSTPDFIDGIVFSKDLAVIIKGTMQSEDMGVPRNTSSEWYYQHVQNCSKSHEEVMTLIDFLFRYDQGAFWMGAYLFHPKFLASFIFQGIFKWSQQARLSEKEVREFHRISSPHRFFRTLFCPWLTSKNLWKLLHKAEKWIHDRMIIQDFCCPEQNAARFLEEVVKDPATFPMWLCPIKGMKSPQIFAPHISSQEDQFSHFINIGIYGMPSYCAPLEEITRKLEQKTKAYGGRKILYSRSYYTQDEFWQIYSRKAYNTLRAKTFSDGVWHEITEKVLSE
jgi:delta24-sterol reductase